MYALSLVSKNHHDSLYDYFGNCQMKSPKIILSYKLNCENKTKHYSIWIYNISNNFKFFEGVAIITVLNFIHLDLIVS